MEYRDDKRHHCHHEHYHHAYDGPEYTLGSIGGIGPNGSYFNVFEEKVSDSDGTYILGVRNKIDGRIVYHSPNLHSGVLSAVQEDKILHLYVTRNSKKILLSDVILPGGEDGSYLFISALPVVKLSSNLTYDFNYEDLAYKGILSTKNSQYLPRLNDAVIAHVIKTGDPNEYLAVGIINELNSSERIATVYFKTFCAVSGGGTTAVQADYSETDPTSPSYIKNRDLIQYKLTNGKYISLDQLGNINIQNLATNADIDSLFK